MFERKPVIFKCRLSSKNLKTNITWYKDRQPIQDLRKNFKILSFRWGSRLKIRRARVGDAGTYQCEVEGPGGTVTAQAQLKINKLNPTLERTPATTSKVLFFLPTVFKPFAPGDFAEKHVLKLVEWFSGHCHAIKS